MHQAIPYKSWAPIGTTAAVPLIRRTNPTAVAAEDKIIQGTRNDHVMIKNMVSETAVIVFTRRGCCMGHVVQRLLLGHGVNPTVYEVDEGKEDEVAVAKELEMICGGSKSKAVVMFPAVFIGGELFGGLESVIAAHISGELVPVLKQAGALWL
ncbi:PREDICTED: glutaredoxin-C9-like [Prunus mume]|uniref:Glutaredoxin-C9-like n=1 Tax=Prunus mume TaxID=102107 RepID=A0ABM0NZ76_PRUMU|nr:PREDICTED: glutaredoxin-C9-like [Prunus mume]